MASFTKAGGAGIPATPCFKSNQLLRNRVLRAKVSRFIPLAVCFGNGPLGHNGDKMRAIFGARMNITVKITIGNFNVGD